MIAVDNFKERIFVISAGLEKKTERVSPDDYAQPPFGQHPNLKPGRPFGHPNKKY